MLFPAYLHADPAYPSEYRGLYLYHSDCEEYTGQGSRQDRTCNVWHFRVRRPLVPAGI